MRIALSTPFSGETRPRNAAYSCFTGCGVSKSSGMPWWIVFTKFTCANGRRCASEIDTSGTLLKRRNTGASSGKSNLPCRVVRSGLFSRLNSDKRPIVQMTVHHIELVGAAGDLLDHHHMRCDRVTHWAAS